ncbi:MAG: hypothetical protein ACI4T2_02870 [Christensenellales bacterium]
MKKLDIVSVLEFSQAQDVTQIAASYFVLLEILNSSMQNISATNLSIVPFDSIKIHPINSFANSSNTPVSELDMMISINSPQLELNSNKLILSKWQKFNKTIKDAWANRNVKKKKKKRKRTVQQAAKHQYFDDLPYNVMRLKNDLFEEIVRHMSNLSIIYNQPYKIKVVANQELGLTFNVYTAIKVGESTKIWNPGLNDFDAYNLQILQNRVDEKTKKLGQNFLKIFRIFNNLYFYINKKQPPIALIESVMFSIPDNLFEGNSIEDCFCSIINYLNNIKAVTMFKESKIEEYIIGKNLQGQTKTQIVGFVKSVCKVLN